MVPSIQAHVCRELVKAQSCTFPVDLSKKSFLGKGNIVTELIYTIFCNTTVSAVTLKLLKSTVVLEENESNQLKSLSRNGALITSQRWAETPGWSCRVPLIYMVTSWRLHQNISFVNTAHFDRDYMDLSADKFSQLFFFQFACNQMTHNRPVSVSLSLFFYSFSQIATINKTI